MTPRLVKQLLYGALYILVIAVIFWLIYVFFLKPAATCFDKSKNQGETEVDCGGPCQSCELARLKPLSVDWAMALPARTNEISLLGEITNPNSNFGVQSFTYQFKVIGPFGSLLKTINGQSFIYPGEIKYILEPALMINLQDVNRVELSVIPESIMWKEFIKPILTYHSLKTAASNQAVSVKGIIKNESPLLISQVKITAILYNSSGNKILNASYTTITDLKGQEERLFSIELPKGDWTKQLDPNRTKIFIEPRTFSE
jgi:hypothetical protein